MTVNRKLWALAALAIVALVGAGCSSASSENGGSGGTPNKATNRDKGVKFAECMRDNGVKDFPDPDASGELTVDGIANGSSVDTNGAAWQSAIGACKDLQPSGFTGHKRSAEQQTYALKFAQCIRENGVSDFPDPAPDAPLVDTRRIPSAAGKGAQGIPELNAAMQTCGVVFADKLGLKGQ